MKPPVAPFGDDRLRLRLIEEGDLETTLQWRNRDEARIWFKTSTIISLEDHLAWFRAYQRRDDDFLFVLERDQKIVGQASVYRIDKIRGEAEIGRFLTAPGEEGKGMMTRACALLLDFSAQALRLTYLYLEVLETNDRAIRLYRRSGFSEERRIDSLLRMGRQI